MAGIVTPDVGRAALDCAARGWSVIPIEARGKRQIVPWQEFLRRVATVDVIAAWYRREDDAPREPNHPARSLTQTVAPPRARQGKACSNRRRNSDSPSVCR
jgi:hypothetical protein